MTSWTAVGTDVREAGLIRIAKGLLFRDRVVTKARAFVCDGDRVNPVHAGAEK